MSDRPPRHEGGIDWKVMAAALEASIAPPPATEAARLARIALFDGAIRTLEGLRDRNGTTLAAARDYAAALRRSRDQLR